MMEGSVTSRRGCCQGWKRQHDTRKWKSLPAVLVACILVSGFLGICECVLSPTVVNDHMCGETFTVSSPNYEASLDVILFSSVVFSFSSCYTGHMSLSSSPRFPDDHLQAYELRLTLDNAYLLNCHGCASSTLLDYSPVLSPLGVDCVTYAQTFWLAWDNDTLLIGQGSSTPPSSASTTLLWQEPLLHPISYLGFASPSSTDVTWSVLNCSFSPEPIGIPAFIAVGFNSTFNTIKPAVTHVLDLSDATNFTFSTVSCNTVFVEAAESLDDFRNDAASATLQIGWSITYLIRHSPYALLAQVSYPFGLSFDCYTNEMTFWISIEDGHMKVGVGSEVSVDAMRWQGLKNYTMIYLGFYGTAHETLTWTINNMFPTTSSAATTVTGMTSPATISSTDCLISSTTLACSSINALDLRLRTWQKQEVDNTTLVIGLSVDSASEFGCSRECLSCCWCSGFHYISEFGQCDLVISSNKPAGNSSVSTLLIYKEI